MGSGQWPEKGTDLIRSVPRKTNIKIKVKIKIFYHGGHGGHGVNLLEFAAEHGDYIVGGDYAYQLVVFVDYRQSD